MGFDVENVSESFFLFKFPMDEPNPYLNKRSYLSVKFIDSTKISIQLKNLILNNKTISETQIIVIAIHIYAFQSNIQVLELFVCSLSR